MINIKYILSIGLSIIIASSHFAIALEMKGIAFAQAAENGTFYCRSADGVAAAACAKLLCESTIDDACYVTKFCWPALFSGIVKFHGDDMQYDMAFCGQPSLKALFATAKAHCRAQNVAGECQMTKILDKEGMALPLPNVSWTSQK